MEKEAKAKAEKSTGFKRSQGLERKLTGLDARAGYQPFSATHGPGGGFDTGGEDMNPDPPEPPPAKKVSWEYRVSHPSGLAPGWQFNWNFWPPKSWPKSFRP